MTRRFRKEDVRVHGHHAYGRPYPAVNVKCYQCGVDADDVAARALRWAWQSAVELFWESAGELARERFGESVKVYSAGRSGGWAVVEGLAPIEDWAGPGVAKWGAFARSLRRETDYRASAAVVLEEIEANRWAEPNAERFNFYDDAQTGKTVCLADLERCAHCAK